MHCNTYPARYETAAPNSVGKTPGPCYSSKTSDTDCTVLLIYLRCAQRPQQVTMSSNCTEISSTLSFPVRAYRSCLQQTLCPNASFSIWSGSSSESESAVSSDNFMCRSDLFMMCGVRIINNMTRQHFIMWVYIGKEMFEQEEYWLEYGID